MARKLFSYVRFSKGRQEAGDSERRQDDLIAAAAREEGVPIDTSVTLRDPGISAFRGANWKRGDLGKFIDLVDAGIIPAGSILCIERVNRMSRMPWMQQVELWKDILTRGIIIRTCDPPARYTRGNMDEIAVGCPVVLYMMLGHMESKQKSDWCRQAFEAMKRRCRENGAPHNMDTPGWVRRVTAPNPRDAERVVTLRYELDPKRTELLRWMHARAQEGWGQRRIAGRLMAAGEKPWHGKRWYPSTINYLLTTRTALGEHQPTRTTERGTHEPDGPPIANVYPAAIDENCWARTQAARRSRKHKAGRPSPTVRNLFTHLVKDAGAESPLYIHTQSANGRRYEYLTIDQNPWTIPYRDFERAVLDVVAALHAADIDGRHQASEFTARVDALQQTRTRLALDQEALDLQLRELPAARWPKRIVARMAEIEQEIAATDEQLRQAKEQADTSTRTETLTYLQTCLRRLDEARGTPEEKPLRERIKGRIPFLIESIWVRMQLQNSRRRYAHVRIYLHGGEQRYIVIPICGPTDDALLLGSADFRAGEERGYVARRRTGDVKRFTARPAM